MKVKFRPRCYFDIHIGHSPAGRIVFELYNDLCPKTVDNFTKLCTGECGQSKTTNKNLHYLNTHFHRVIKGFMIQGGDFSSGDGAGSESIYGYRFADENLDIPHDRPFLLSMANFGPNTNGSQFFITTKSTPHLNKKHVVFGHVVTGENIIESIENLPVNSSNKPVVDATIANCGELIPVRKSRILKAKENGVYVSTEEINLNHKSKKTKHKNKKISKDMGKDFAKKSKIVENVDRDRKHIFKDIMEHSNKVEFKYMPRSPKYRSLHRKKDSERSQMRSRDSNDQIKHAHGHRKQFESINLINNGNKIDDDKRLNSCDAPMKLQEQITKCDGQNDGYDNKNISRLDEKIEVHSYDNRQDYNFHRNSSLKINKRYCDKRNVEVHLKRLRSINRSNRSNDSMSRNCRRNKSKISKYERKNESDDSSQNGKHLRRNELDYLRKVSDTEEKTCSTFNQRRREDNKRYIEIEKHVKNEDSKKLINRDETSLPLNRFEDIQKQNKSFARGERNFDHSEEKISQIVTSYSKTLTTEEMTVVESNRKMMIESPEFNKYENILFESSESRYYPKVDKRCQSINVTANSKKISSELGSVNAVQLHNVTTDEVTKVVQASKLGSNKCIEDCCRRENILLSSLCPASVNERIPKHLMTSCQDQRHKITVTRSSISDSKDRNNSMSRDSSSKYPASILRTAKIIQHRHHSPNKEKEKYRKCDVLSKEKSKIPSLSSGTVDSSSSSDGSSASNRPCRIDSDLSDRERNVNTQCWVDGSNHQQSGNTRQESIFKTSETVNMSEKSMQMTTKLDLMPQREIYHRKTNDGLIEMVDKGHCNGTQMLDNRPCTIRSAGNQSSHVNNDDARKQNANVSPISQSISKYRRPSDSSSSSLTSSSSKSRSHDRQGHSRIPSNAFVQRYRSSRFLRR